MQVKLSLVSLYVQRRSKYWFQKSTLGTRQRKSTADVQKFSVKHPNVEERGFHHANDILIFRLVTSKQKLKPNRQQSMEREMKTSVETSQP